MYDEREQEQKHERKVVNTYDPNDLYRKPPKKSGGSGWKKGLIIFLVIVLVVVFAGVGCSSRVVGLLGSGWDNGAENYVYTNDYIGVLPIHGEMVMGDNSSSEYNQTWIIARINQMMNDSLNRGIILTVNTPGGAVYAADELYLKLKEYKEYTGRPIYVYMESTAASGGYYISMAAEKIYANRNCWTGSIGVTIGTIYDISGFLEKMGISTVTITSGENKAMGDTSQPMTDEQKAIFQSLVDEAYDQFVEIVAEGRNMPLKDVKKLADGRIYTALQAKENGLIDEIGTLDDVAADMKRTYELEDCDVQTLHYEVRETLYSLLTGLAQSNKSSAESEFDALMRIMEKNGTFTVTYLSQVRK